MQHSAIEVHVTRLSRADITPFVRSSTVENEGLFNAIFEQIADIPWSLLLDTAGSTKSGGRYNIILHAPAKVIEAKRGSVFLRDNLKDNTDGTLIKLDEPPFEATQTYLHRHVENAVVTSDEDINHLPFIVGVAGMAGYDTGRFYETLPTQSKADYHTPDFAAGLYLGSIIEDTHTGNIYYCASDKSKFPAFLTPQHTKTTSKSDFHLTTPFTSNLTKDEYTACLKKIGAYLRAGDCYQVNMAQRFSATFSGDVWNAYCALRATNRAPFSAFFKTDVGCVASISPERFLRVVNGVVETKPIKGTRPRFDNPEDDIKSASQLLNAPKDRAENLMIVDLLRNDISKHCKPHSVEVPSLFALESYEAVHHLVSTIVGELNASSSPLNLLASAFPGGSITGAPKIRAMEIIDELEPHRRNIYCGSIFYMGFKEDMDSSICIRTVLAENDQLHCWAGGGIVLDSVVEDEYQETLDKVSKIIPVLTALNATS